jgi:7-cyano-7-deazaguanine synthase
MHTTALVLFSGGQDSTTCLAQALSKYQRVETIAFDYRQRHSVELQARLKVLSEIRTQFPPWADRLGEDHLLDLAVLGQVSETSLTRDTAFKMEPPACPIPSYQGATCCFLRWRPHWPTVATCRSSLPACARPTSRVTRTVATTP